MQLSGLEAAIFRGLLKASKLALPTGHALGPTQLAELPRSKTIELLELCKKLAAEAYRNGFLEPPDIPPEEFTDLLGGAVAQFVVKVRTKKDFAFKADDWGFRGKAGGIPKLIRSAFRN